MACLVEKPLHEWREVNRMLRKLAKPHRSKPELGLATFSVAQQVTSYLT